MKKIWTIIITSLINVERSKHNLQPVVYNYTLDNYLKNDGYKGDWYYGTSDKTINWTIEGQNRFCNINGCHYKPLGYNYLFRETYKDSIPKIIRMRLAQRDCNHTDFKDGEKCSWWYAYYKTLMQPEFSSYACKSLNFQGLWTPEWLLNIQKKSFWCYFNTKVFYLV